MLNFFRRLTRSRIGVAVTLAILVLIALAFAAGDITGSRLGKGTVLGGSIAQVGDQKVSEAEFNERARLEFESARRQNPSLTMEQFVEQGGADRVVETILNSTAFDQFADENGIVVSKKSVDTQIVNIPAFQGIDGKFNQATFEQLLRQRRITEKQVRGDIRRQLLSQWLIGPIIGAGQVPDKLALPYASLLLEEREGAIGFVPIQAVNPGKLPDDKALTDYFKRNRSHYVIPERRVMRYAMVSPDRFKDQVTPSAAEIAEAYKKAGSRFAATEKRSIRQVVLADQAAAKALADKVKSGTAIGDAARAAGLEAASIDGVERAAYAQQADAALAQAVFSADRGAVIGPVKGPLGWYVARVESVDPIAGKTLAQATPELTEELTKVKTQEMLADLHDKLDDGIADNSTFAELVADAKLEAKATPPLLGTGAEPGKPDAQPDPAMARIAAAGFSAELDDDPQLVQVGQDGAFALVALDGITPAAPPPLADIREAVTRDYMIDAGVKAARKLADQILANVKRDTSLKQAFAAAGVRLPAPEPIKATRADLERAQGKVPPPIALMFSMAANTAKVIEAPNRGGWYIVDLDKIVAGDASKRDEVITYKRRQLGSQVGREYAEQFAEAVRREVGIKRNKAAIDRLRAGLAGGSQP